MKPPFFYYYHDIGPERDSGYLMIDNDCWCDNCSITQFAKLIKDVPMTEKEVSMLTTRFLEKLLILSRNETQFWNARELT